MSHWTYTNHHEISSREVTETERHGESDFGWVAPLDVKAHDIIPTKRRTGNSLLHHHV